MRGRSVSSELRRFKVAVSPWRWQLHGCVQFRRGSLGRFRTYVGGHGQTPPLVYVGLTMGSRSEDSESGARALASQRRRAAFLLPPHSLHAHASAPPPLSFYFVSFKSSFSPLCLLALGLPCSSSGVCSAPWPASRVSLLCPTGLPVRLWGNSTWATYSGRTSLVLGFRGPFPKAPWCVRYVSLV